MTLQGVFFDLDDTLIGYEAAERAAIVAGWRVAARRYPSLSEASLLTALYQIYRERFQYPSPGFGRLTLISEDELRRELTVAALERLDIQDRGLVDAMLAAHAHVSAQALAPLAGAVEVLQALRPSVRLGIITNGPAAMQRGKLARLGLEGFFDAIVVDTEFGFPKPDPRIFEHAARLVELTPESLCFVGNTLDADVAGARRSGWMSVWFNAVGAPAAWPQPDYTIMQLSDLLRLEPFQRRLGRRPLLVA
jgi:HAD superfamily hydrolase (TIGR01549 family)